MSTPEPNDPDVPVLDFDPTEPCPRSDEELREQWEFFQDPDFERPRTLQHTRGVRESLRWVMGQRPDSPVTGVVLGRRPYRWEIAREADLAEEGMRAFTTRGAAWHLQHGGGFLTGCENALWWAAKLSGDDGGWGI
ncbi:hypothetical protein ACWENQ_45610 [Nonomuraea sp. NPDC004354]